MKHKPSYYGILPANVRYDKRLKPMARIMYSEITCLSNKTGECTAGNKYFSDLYEVTNDTITRWINQLIECGYISRELIYKEGTKQVKQRTLKINSTPLVKKQGGYPEKNQYPPSKKVEDNNTSNNNTSIISEGTSQELAVVQEKDIKKIGKLCKEIKIATSGSVNGWYKNKTQRKALEDMIAEFGVAMVYKQFSKLPKYNKRGFKQITTPKQLQDNWYAVENTNAKKKEIVSI